MKDAIGYLRVSTSEQGRSGLGLAAQRHDIDGFSQREGFSIKSWYQDIQTGAGKDALLLRAGLAAGLKEARRTHCPLIVSRLDRLSRNVHFITGLMDTLSSPRLAATVTISRCTSMPRSQNRSGK
jgi:DNA invertase Pin-like site-specific DNA recombinase